MPKKPQVSIKGEIYAKVKAHCQALGISVSDFADKLCSDFFKQKAKTDHRDARF